MSRHRDARRCALQALYQFEAGSAEAPDIVLGSLADAPGDEATHNRGFELATLAWEFRDDADAAVAALTSQWPTHRQPVVDRAILRLAYYELTHTDTPPKVVINEAVELAKEYSTEKSPLFINGILDKLYRHRCDASANAEPAPEAAPEAEHESTDQSADDFPDGSGPASPGESGEASAEHSTSQEETTDGPADPVRLMNGKEIG